MALISVLSRLSRNLKVSRPYLKPDLVYTYRYAVSRHPDAILHRVASFASIRPTCGYLQHVKQYASTPACDPEGDNRTMWLIEHAVQVSLLGLVPAAFAFPSEVLNHVLATVFVIHHHWGFAHILGDYASVRNVGGFLSKAVQYLNYLISALVLAGLCLFNHNDVGIAEAVRMAWELDKEEPEPVEEKPETGGKKK